MRNSYLIMLVGILVLILGTFLIALLSGGNYQRYESLGRIIGIFSVGFFLFGIFWRYMELAHDENEERFGKNNNSSGIFY